MEEYRVLFARLEALKAEMERAEARGGESAEFLRLRRQLLTLELEITDLRLRDLGAPAPRPASPPQPVPPSRPATPSRPAPEGSYYFSRPQGERPAPPAPKRRPSAPPPPRPPKKPRVALSESSIGKYILSLLASLLILLGCCALILMGWGYMSPPVRAAVIALGGALFLGAGQGLGKRLPKPFTDSLTACGLGILYADVIALYQAWALVPLWGVLGLILAWDAACVLLGRRGKSKLFYYVLGLGNLVTAALVSQLISDSPLSAVSLLFVGCTQAGAIWAFRRQYGKFDPVLAFTGGAAVLYLDATHYATIHHFFQGYRVGPGPWVVLCLALCFALSCLLLWSAGRILGLKPGRGGTAAYLCLTIPVLLGSLLMSSALGHYAGAASGLPVLGHHLPLLLAALAGAGMLLSREFRKAAYCVCAPVLFCAAEGLAVYHKFDVSGAALAALGSGLVYLRYRDKVSQWVCAAAYGLCLGLGWMLQNPVPYVLAALLSLALPILLAYSWRACESRRQALGITLCGYAAALVLLRGAVLWDLVMMDEMFALAFLALLGVLLAAFPLALKGAYSRRPVLRLHERIQAFGFDAVLLFWTLGFEWAGPAARALAVLLLFVQGLNLLHGAYFRWDTGGRCGWGIAAAGCLTVNAIRCAQMTPAGAWPIFLSVLCIAMAVGYIVLGFHRQAKPLRIFGLVLSIASVLKMVTLDIVGSPSLFRVAALLLGGVLCFAISFVYNRVEQKAAKQTVPNDR